MPSKEYILLRVLLLIKSGMNKKRLLKSMFLLPLAVPTASIVLVWRVVFHEQGILNGILVQLESVGKSWIGSKIQ